MLINASPMPASTLAVGMEMELTEARTTHRRSVEELFGSDGRYGAMDVGRRGTAEAPLTTRALEDRVQGQRPEPWSAVQGLTVPRTPPGLPPPGTPPGTPPRRRGRSLRSGTPVRRGSRRSQTSSPPHGSHPPTSSTTTSAPSTTS